MRDVLMVLMVVNELRHRVVTRIFGVSREQSNSVTVVATGMLADRVGAAAVALPSAAALALGAAAVKETVNSVAGPSSRVVPRFGALLAFAVLAGSVSPFLRGSAQGLRQFADGCRAGARRARAFLVGAGSA